MGTQERRDRRYIEVQATDRTDEQVKSGREAFWADLLQLVAARPVSVVELLNNPVFKRFMEFIDESNAEDLRALKGPTDEKDTNFLRGKLNTKDFFAMFLKYLQDPK
jgi:hypothetical protein